MDGYRYTGRDGQHYIGVPARDLTAEEFAALTVAQQAVVVAGGLYEPVIVPAVRATRAPVSRPVIATPEGDPS